MTSVIKVDTIQNSTGTSALSIGADGTVTAAGTIAEQGLTYKPAFHVRRNNDFTYNGNANITGWSSAELNRNSDFNLTTGQFTAPVSGAYFFSGTALLKSFSTDGGHLGLSKNGSTDVYIYGAPGRLGASAASGTYGFGGYAAMGVHSVVNLSQGETVALWVGTNSGTLHGSNSWFNFSGFLIG